MRLDLKIDSTVVRHLARHRLKATFQRGQGPQLRGHAVGSKPLEPTKLESGMSCMHETPETRRRPFFESTRRPEPP